MPYYLPFVPMRLRLPPPVLLVRRVLIPMWPTKTTAEQPSAKPVVHRRMGFDLVAASIHATSSKSNLPSVLVVRADPEPYKNVIPLHGQRSVPGCDTDRPVLIDLLNLKDLCRGSSRNKA